MKKYLSISIALLVGINCCFAQSKSNNVIHVLTNVNFYDGYAKPVTEPVPDGLIRPTNTTYLRKLTNKEKQAINDSLMVKVTVTFGCDDYDRIGRVTIISVPKNEDYNSPAAKEFEMLRIMTPFNYKTRQPDNIPYIAAIPQLAGLFKNKETDIWVRTEIFGTTGAGQKETMGCAGSFLTYTASVDFITNNISQAKGPQTIPLLNYFSLNGKDTSAGFNSKEIAFHINNNTQSTTLYLISSGHGAAQGGEEYNWREHVLYLDGKEIAKIEMKQDCVPYEIYNTRTNGIYGGGNIAGVRRSWCPGAPVPTRLVNLGPLKTGDYKLKITIPDAKFLGTDNKYFVSAYIAVQE